MITLMFLYVTRKMNKEKFLFYANVYTNIKTVLNVLFACIIMRVLGVKELLLPKGMVLVIVLLGFVFISTLDSYLIFRRIKRLRQLCIRDVKYLLDYVKNSLIMVGIFLVVIQLKYIVKDAEDYLFLGICVVSIWIYQYSMPYILKMTNKTGSTELTGIKIGLLKKCDIQNKFKLFSYEGKSSKSANAVVVGTSLNRHVFISDYFLENASEEEVIAILCHECGHIKNLDLEKRIIFIDIAIVVFFNLTCLMDLLKIGFAMGSILLLVLVGVGFYLYKKMQQKQELRADKFSVSVMGEESVFISAITKLYEMNDMLKKNNKFFALFSTHPQLGLRINNLENSQIGKEVY